MFKQDADVNVHSNSDETALHWAVVRQEHELSSILLEDGADVNAGDAFGRTPLNYAVASEYEDLDPLEPALAVMVL